ncbi:hypothetical protein ABIE26_000196 [Pedobacter africanus]|uniref:Uncharacterized protein n=1 Tax=Pedobacter africanus TaxID=151894 RepID=A0ACC6KW64_9SPHI|nr:hypothetical protein [Pedobacter africanus]MDR6783316.1 hypothetical protein [Pedobacter africanus]
MMRKLLYITGGIVLSFVAVFLGSKLFKADRNKGFHRKIIEQDFYIAKVLQLPSGAYYFVDHAERGLYLKDLKQANSLFITGHDLSRVHRVNLSPIPGIDDKRKKINIGVSDTIIHAIDHKTGQVTLLNKMTRKIRRFKEPQVRIDNTILISDQSLIGRSTIINGAITGRQLIKLNYSEAKTKNTFQLEKQVDGYFCTDGLLRYDPAAGRLIYMYVYRGEFLCLDTNLNLLYKSKTIDTVSRAEITVNRKVNNGQLVSVTQSKPPKPVNRNLIVHRNLVFMVSTIKADNEAKTDFKSNQVIDVYAINSGKYLYSFYIPKYLGLKLNDFRIADDFMFAVFGTNLVKFKFNKAALLL